MVYVDYRVAWLLERMVRSAALCKDIDYPASEGTSRFSPDEMLLESDGTEDSNNNLMSTFSSMVIDTVDIVSPPIHPQEVVVIKTFCPRPLWSVAIP